tara:strand:- start:122 stop:376 length:255 start_codon:yes stop_codon:yes gene_type:complete
MLEYLGEIPQNLTYEQLIPVMANGIHRYRLDQDEELTIEDVKDVIDLMCEHDNVRDKLFDHLVPPNEGFDEFVSLVLEKESELE